MLRPNCGNGCWMNKYYMIKIYPRKLVRMTGAVPLSKFFGRIKGPTGYRFIDFLVIDV
jgi:hypothetical protein